MAPITVGFPLVTLTPAAEVTTTVTKEALAGSLNSRTTALGAVVSCASTAGVILTSLACADADVALTTAVTAARAKADDATTATVAADRKRREAERGRYHDEWVDMASLWRSCVGQGCPENPKSNKSPKPEMGSCSGG